MPVTRLRVSKKPNASITIETLQVGQPLLAALGAEPKQNAYAAKGDAAECDNH